MNKPSFGTKGLSSSNERIDPQPEPAEAPAPVLAPIPEDTTAWVSFTTAVTRDTYLKLKQAEHWVPGFLMKDFTEAALIRELENCPEANKPLPEPVLQKLLKTSKKLR